ncbi:S1C family serine protease [Streptosporangium longisporum]|uniref:Peptidase S1 n=1 Tax=Streptosporangium longisporum TaxID=46187 RepID=A0ABP6KRT5_9ACTN
MVMPHDRPPGLGRPRGPGFAPGPPPPTSPEAPSRAAGATAAPAVPVRKGSGRLLAAAVLVAALTGGAAGVAGGRLAVGDEAAPAALPRAAAAPPAPSGSSGSPGSAGGLSGTAARVLPSVVSVESGRGAGSGFVIDGSGHLLTNAHVLAGSAAGAGVTVVLDDGRRLPAVVVGTDEAYDLAVLRVDDARGLTAAVLGRSADLAVGDQVLAVGSPLGLAGTVTGGIVSALDRQVRLGGRGQTALQTDASINPGNSGGPLVNARGEVIGINTAIATLSRRGTGSIGIGFAIPIDRAVPVAERIIRG